MCLPAKLCLSGLLIFNVFDGALPRNLEDHRNDPLPSDSNTWATHWRPGHPTYGDPIPDFDYAKTLIDPPLHPAPQASRTLRAINIPHTSIASSKKSPEKYKGRIIATVSDGPRKRNLKHRLRHAELRQYSQDQPLTPRPRPQPCVRCPGDRAVLAPKGSNTVLMDTPPIIPCHPWSSVEKVKSEVLAGPPPGSKMAEGSHKMVIRLYRHKRTLATCVIRYNVIVRKCPELELDTGVMADCPLGKVWGSHCNLSCSPGYDLDGDSTAECSDDLEWTGLQPQCILSTSCLAPISPDNGHITCRTPQHRSGSFEGASVLPDGTVCHFRCHPGYVVPPELANLTRVRCIAGSWDIDQDPVCVETNEIEEEELPPDMTADEALRLDGKDCPENYCLNGGKCLIILEEPMCSCLPGYVGHQCEIQDTSLEVEGNAIT